MSSSAGFLSMLDLNELLNICITYNYRTSIIFSKKQNKFWLIISSVSPFPTQKKKMENNSIQTFWGENLRWIPFWNWVIHYCYFYALNKNSLCCLRQSTDKLNDFNQYYRIIQYNGKFRINPNICDNNIDYNNVFLSVCE